MEPDEAERAGLQALQERIAVTFRRPALLQQAMTHASWNNERGGPAGPGHDNERLEYLGDAVLELVVGEFLFRRFPDYDEGRLTQLRAALVNTVSLARFAERLGLGDALLLGKGAAKTGAARLPSLLANAFEAMIGAIFLDQGYRVATRVFLQNVGDIEEWSDENHKGRLQELAQERTGQPPQYRTEPIAGGGRREYRAEAVVGGEVVGSGTGGTKQAAEQAAARLAVELLTSRRGRRAAAGGRTLPAPPSRRRATTTTTTRAAVAPARAARTTTVDTEPGRTARRGGARRSGDDVLRETAAAPLVASGDPEAPRRRRGLFGALRSAAEAIVGRRDEPPAPPPLPPAAPPAAGRSRSRSRSAGATPAAGATATPRAPRRRPAATATPAAAEPAAAAAGEEAGAARRTHRGRRGGRGRRRPGDGEGGERDAS